MVGKNGFTISVALIVIVCAAIQVANRYSGAELRKPNLLSAAASSTMAQPLVNPPRDTSASAAKLVPAPLRLPARSVEIRRATLTFPHGAQATVALRPFRLPSIRRPERLIDIYAELVTLADGGDADASFSLYRWLRECDHEFPNEELLTRAIDRLNSERVVSGPSLREVQLETTASLESAATAMRQTFEFCQDISPDQRSEADNWLEMSMASGELFALKAHAQELRRQSREKSHAAYARLWKEHGYSGALSPLAITYLRPGGQLRPDYLRAYAYMLIEYELVETVYGLSAFPAHRSMLRGMEQGMSATAANLTPEQTLEAEGMAVALLNENGKCCIGILFGTTQ